MVEKRKFGRPKEPINLYNEELKNKFLETYNNEQTKILVKRLFNRTAKIERKFDKDLYEMTEKELHEVLLGFNATNRRTVEVYGRFISSYFNWCIKQGLKDDNIFNRYSPEDFEPFVTNKEQYLSEEQLRQLEDQCVNYQDAVILRLLFEGVSGKSFSEVLYLKKTDVDFEKRTLTLTNVLKEKDGVPLKYSKRVIKVSERAIKLIKGAIDQKIYYKKNGAIEDEILEGTTPNNISEALDLINNEYVIRPSITYNVKSSTENQPVGKALLYRRLENLSKYFGLSLKPKLVQRSGMVWYCAKLIGDADEITQEDWDLIADRFQIKTVFNLKSYISIETVRDMYPSPNIMKIIDEGMNFKSDHKAKPLEEINQDFIDWLEEEYPVEIIDWGKHNLKIKYNKRIYEIIQKNRYWKLK